MFTDQIGSTARSEQRTASDKRRVSEEQSALTAQAAGLCRGQIISDTGDGHMLTFGACADAVLCGHLIQQSVQERNAHLSNANLQFDLHIGIDYGPAVPMRDGNIRSDAANCAARVCSLCPTGEVYLTEKVAKEVHPGEAEVAQVGDFDLKGVSVKIVVYRLLRWLDRIPHAPNPFVWRGPITEATAFFDRDEEQRQLKDCLAKRQNCQILGERRIGKTSLLLQVAREILTWQPTSVVAAMDMQHPACFTQSGFLGRAATQFGWPASSVTLTEFAERIEAMCREQVRPVLTIDEFEEFTMRRGDFGRDFFLALRSCSQLPSGGLSIITTSRRPLSQLTDRDDPTSPFYNNFHRLTLGPFAPKDAEDFLTVFRPGISGFTPEEKARIQEFAHGHPMALQIACYYVVEAKVSGGPLSVGLRGANDEMRTLMPSASW
jgi:hypothetical protein